MTIFATEGCAACHRLKGFESNVGYRIEKEGKPDFDAIYKEKEWFTRLFPEEILGSSIVSVIEENSEAIDQHIVDGVRKDSILEEIDEKYPEAVEALYANFRFASRAKNHDYQELADKAVDQQIKKEALDNLKAWKARVKRILMMYVQEYGLGRLVGPRPNWAGVYRTDEWLMEHFHSPATHVARSIMPVMPFDDSKFYALTYMLDMLGERNRDAVRSVWAHKGFRPEEAYARFCSQCHGDYMQGNGPIATWIYPIPKNLRNAEFLRNLTRENVIQSITHGVKGTPMPPWGEHPQPKPDYDGTPIMTSDEIAALADWLYSFLPGGTVIRGSSDVPKWNYSPGDVIDELKREGNRLELEESKKSKESGSLPVKSKAALGLGFVDKNFSSAVAQASEVKPAQQSSKEDWETIFNVEPNPASDGGKTLYFIKKEYYTKENIEKGQNFFELNCAVCHGREADGSGARAGIMFDAKPRMLTNLDWLKTRDDLRLLRSIKYGVAGTAMTPWGDLTSSLQRLQLVIFIRTLSQEKEKRDDLLRALYAAFEVAQSTVEELRISEYPQLDSLQKEYTLIRHQRTDKDLLDDKKKTYDLKLSVYQKQLELEEKLRAAKKQDKILADLKALIAKERDLYFSIGNDMISSNVDEEIWKKFLRIITLNSGRFAFENGKLAIQDNSENEKKLQTLLAEIVAILDHQKNAAEKEKVVIQGKFPSSERDEELQSLQMRLNTINKLKNKLLSGMQEDQAIENQERLLFESLETTKKKKIEK